MLLVNSLVYDYYTRFKQLKWLCCTKEFGESQAVVASFQATKWRSTMRGRRNIPEAAAGGGVQATPGRKQEEEQHQQESTESSIIDDDDDDFA